MSEFVCYLLVSNDNKKKKIYIGATTNIERRLKQHNREKAGGARATAGHTWNRVAYVTGFPNWKETLRFEWAWKRSGTYGVIGRMRGLAELLTKERPTTKAVSFFQWNTKFVLWIHKDWIDILEHKGYLDFYYLLESPNLSYNCYKFPSCTIVNPTIDVV